MVNPTSKRKRTLENSSEKRPHSQVASGKRSHSRCVIDFTRNDCPRFEMDGGADAIPLLDAFVYPLTVTDFKETFWKKNALAVHGGISRFESIIEDQMGNLDLMYLLQETPSDQIYAWMKEKSNDTTQDGGPLDSVGVDDPRTAETLHRAGASLYFRAPQELSDAIVTPMQRDLGLSFAGNFADGDNRGEIETFVSRAGHTTDWHFDFMENFTFQLSGSKRWKFKKGPPSPLRGCTPHYKEDVSVVEMQAKVHKLRSPNASKIFHHKDDASVDYDEVVLKAGSVLYFPAGMWHRVECEEDSISINVSLKAPCWGDIVTSAFRQLLWQDDAWRESVCVSMNPGEAHQKLGQLMDGLKEKLSKITAQMILPPQMLVPHAMNIAQEQPYPKSNKNNRKHDKDNNNANLSKSENENEETSYEDVEVEVTGRTRGGPSFGGKRKFMLLGIHSDDDNAVISCLKAKIEKQQIFKKNPLAVLVSREEVPNLGRSDTTKFSLHINFGNEQVESMHHVLIDDASENNWASNFLSKWNEDLSKDWLLHLEGIHRADVLRNGNPKKPSGGLPHVDTANRTQSFIRSLLSRIGLGQSKQKMMMPPTPLAKSLVLIGGGHTHAFVLKSLGMPMNKEIYRSVQVTLVTRDINTPYSGMLPGYVAGMYTTEECHIDLGRLAAFANVRLVHAEAIGIDRFEKKVILRGRPPIAYDVLSINIGSSPQLLSPSPSLNQGNLPITPVKPIGSFSARWEEIIKRVTADSIISVSQPLDLAVVGAGAGGVELALSMQCRLEKELQKAGKAKGCVRYSIFSSRDVVLPAHSVQAQRIFSRILAERGWIVHLASRVVGVETKENGKKRYLVTSEGKQVACDECVWCTAAAAQPWLRASGLETDGRGFIRVHPTLESINSPNIFAAGDICDIVGHPRAKAGVFAVRAGPPLARNLKLALCDRRNEMEYWAPQERFLGIIGVGDRSNCVASKGAMAVEGKYLWELKDWIDRKWMAGYTTMLPKMAKEMQDQMVPDVPNHHPAGAEALALLSHATMRCGGCGAKVGASTLSRVMKRLQELKAVPTRPELLVGIDAPDDAAVVSRLKSGMVSVQSVDFFRQFIRDPYTFGKVAANHALSDCHAMGAQAVTALAIAVVPFAVESVVEENLFQMMAGACEALRESGCALAGGHSCEGAELMLGFSVYGEVNESKLMTKSRRMMPGDKLILTKGLGTGTLFAADMRVQASGVDIEAALKSMTTSNAPAADVLKRFGVSAATDVTGFGLLGHAIEMLKSGGMCAEIDISRVPLLPGALASVRKGITSSLQPENFRLRRAVSNQEEAARDERYPLLFDPQTAGGLLAAVPSDKASACVAALVKSGFPDSCVIGTIVAPFKPESKDPAIIVEKIKVLVSG
eukprot:g1983.t1